VGASRGDLERKGNQVSSSDARGLRKVDVRLRWDPSPWHRPPHHLDILTVLTVPQSYAADFSTGPDGRRLLIGGGESGVHA
jgi:tellurium resistance protein TerD